MPPAQSSPLDSDSRRNLARVEPSRKRLERSRRPSAHRPGSPPTRIRTRPCPAAETSPDAHQRPVGRMVSPRTLSCPSGERETTRNGDPELDRDRMLERTLGIEQCRGCMRTVRSRTALRPAEL